MRLDQMIEVAPAFEAVGLWIALRLLLLVLTVNVTRLRFKEEVAVGVGESVGLERAVRAHGNAAEAVPPLLTGLGAMALVFLF